MKVFKKLTSVLVCLAIILSMGANTVAAFASEGEMQVAANAFSPEGDIVRDMSVNIFEKGPDYMNYITSANPDSEGMVYLSGLEAGKEYALEFYPYYETNLVSYGYIPVIIDENGNATGQSSITVVLNRAQLEINRLNPDLTPTDSGYLEIRDTNNNYISSVGYSYSMTAIKVGGIPDGDYTVRLYPYSGNPYCKSELHSFTIENGVITKWDNQDTLGNMVFDVTLTNPQITGTVAYPDTGVGQFASVSVFEGADANTWIDSVPAENGSFAIGGLEPNKTYSLIANPLNNEYRSSDWVIVTTDEYGNASPNYIDFVLSEGEEVQIEAVIYDSQGNQVTSDAYLQLQSFEGFSGKVDGYWGEDGRFYYGGLTDGMYMLYAEAFGALRSPENIASEKKTIEIAGGVLVSVDGNAVLDNTIVFNLRPAQVAASAFSPEGDIVRDMSVNVFEKGPEYMNYVTSGYTDSEGMVYISGLEAGKEYALGFNPGYDTNLVSYEYEPFTIDENGNYTGQSPITVVLNRAQFQINKLNPDLSQTDSGPLEIRDSSGNNISSVGYSYSMTGIKVGGLADGNYIVRLYPNYDSPYCKSMPHSFTIENGVITKWDNQDTLGNTVFDIALTNPQITGTVAYPDTGVGQFAGVSIYEGTDASKWIDGVAADNGSFAIGGLEPNKTYSLMAYPQNDEYRSSDWVVVTTDEYGNASPNYIDFVLREQGSRLKCFVFDTSGNLAAEASVMITNPEWDYRYTLSINEKGEILDELADGSYTVYAIPRTGDSVNARSGEINFIIEGGKLTSINGEPCSEDTPIVLQLNPVSVVVTLTDIEGNPVDGYVDVFDITDDTFWYGNQTDENGRFYLGTLEANKQYQIWAYCGPEMFSLGNNYIYTNDLGNPGETEISIVLYRPQVYAAIKDKDGNIVTNDFYLNIEPVGDTSEYGLALIDDKQAVYGLNDGEYTLTAFGCPGPKENLKTKPIIIVIENGCLKSVDGQLTDQANVELIIAANTLEIDTDSRKITASDMAVTDEAGKCSITLGDELSADIIGALQSLQGNKAFDFIYNITDSSEANKIEVNLPVKLIKEFASNKKKGSITISSEIGSMTLNNSAIKKLERLIRKNDKYVTVSIEKMSADKYLKTLPKILAKAAKYIIGDKPVYDFTVNVGKLDVSVLGKNDITVTLPYVKGSERNPKFAQIFYVNYFGILQLGTNLKYDPIQNTISFTPVLF